MEFLQEHQMSIMLALAFGSGLLSLFSFIQLSTSPVRKNALFSMSLCSMLLLIADRQAYFFRGNTTSLGFMMTKTSNFMVFLMTLTIILSFNWYLSDFFDKDFQISLKRLDVAKHICYFAICLLLISQFTNLYYYFDEENLYHRANGFIFCYAFPLAILIIQLSVIIQNYHRFRKRIFFPLLFFTVIPLIASILQIFMYGLSLTNMSIVGLVILLRIFAVVDTNKVIVDAHKKEMQLLNERHESAKTMILQTSEALASAIDAKDKYTNGHSKRVSDYSVMIAKRAGKSADECEKIRIIALMHDVGKIGIPDNVINKDSKLNDEEYALIKQHPSIGKDILSNIKISPELSIGAYCHHERYDGKGYPKGLKGEQIPEIARLIAVADTYDAMASKRSYRDVMPQAEVREQILKGIGSQFDPKFAWIMINLIDEDTDYQMRQM